MKSYALEVKYVGDIPILDISSEQELFLRRIRQVEKFHRMRVSNVLILTGVTTVGILFVRRLLRIRAATSELQKLAHRVGLDVLPVGYFRVCISGTSSGIGNACAHFLSRYRSVKVFSLGRPESCDFVVDLSDPSAIRSCAIDIEREWYKGTCAPSAGFDVLINNAGVFSAATASAIHWINSFAPAFLTEDLSERYIRNKIKSRMLRFVQVSSRLESKSTLTAENMRGSISESMEAPTRTLHYADSKRAMMYHTSFMHNKFTLSHPSLSYVTVTPGMVNTALGRSSVWAVIWYLSYPIRFLFLRSPIEGALPVIWAAFGCPTESGVFTADQEILERISATRDPEAGRIFSELVHESFNSI